MNKTLIQVSLVLGLLLSAPTSMALTDSYYASGEDLDFLTEAESTFAIEEIEYELRQFVLYRKLEDLLFNLSEGFPEMSD
jgi:hypothetical protein